MLSIATRLRIDDDKILPEDRRILPDIRIKSKYPIVDTNPIKIASHTGLAKKRISFLVRKIIWQTPLI